MALPTFSQFPSNTSSFRQTVISFTSSLLLTIIISTIRLFFFGSAIAYKPLRTMLLFNRSLRQFSIRPKNRISTISIFDVENTMRNKQSYNTKSFQSIRLIDTSVVFTALLQTTKLCRVSTLKNVLRIFIE